VGKLEVDIATDHAGTAVKPQATGRAPLQRNRQRSKCRFSIYRIDFLDSDLGRGILTAATAVLFDNAPTGYRREFASLAMDAGGG
jgi:hypothetical protein